MLITEPGAAESAFDTHPDAADPEGYAAWCEEQDEAEQQAMLRAKLKPGLKKMRSYR